MNAKNPMFIALQFNEYINARDIDNLSELMADDYTFIDSKNGVHKGKSEMVEAWTDFFSKYPDYRNLFTRVECRDNLVLLSGRSKCIYEPLDGPAIWAAKIENDLVAEWRIYVDNEENRRKLKLRELG